MCNGNEEYKLDDEDAEFLGWDDPYFKNPFPVGDTTTDTSDLFDELGHPKKGVVTANDAQGRTASLEYDKMIAQSAGYVGTAQHRHLQRLVQEAMENSDNMEDEATNQDTNNLVSQLGTQFPPEAIEQAKMDSQLTGLPLDWVLAIFYTENGNFSNREWQLSKEYHNYENTKWAGSNGQDDRGHGKYSSAQEGAKIFSNTINNYSDKQALLQAAKNGDIASFVQIMKNHDATLIRNEQEKAIASLVRMCKKMNGSMLDAVQSVVSDYDYSEEEATTIVQKYWNEVPVTINIQLSKED